MIMKKKLGIIVGIAAIALGWYWFGWQLPVVILMSHWGNNLERGI